jgi:hypothetical protein
MTDLKALLQNVRESPFDRLPQLVLADYYEENGESHNALQCRVEVPPASLVILSYGYGDGNYGYGNNGYGDGTYGNGYGYGYGNNGYGDGTYGNGYGYGYGYGNGDGYGYGNNGDGNGNLLLPNWRNIMPEVGKNQLIILPHGWVICGMVIEQDSPFTFKVTDASVICRTGGVPWDELADGKRRSEAIYRLWGDVRIGPQFIMSRLWVGKLPNQKKGK